MFFIASKALWFFAAPSALLILGALIGAAFSARRGGQLLALGCLAIAAGHRRRRPPARC